MVNNTRFELDQLVNKLEIRLFNQLGQQVAIARNNNSKYVDLDRKQLAEGIYFYQIFKNEQAVKTGQLRIQ